MNVTMQDSLGADDTSVDDSEPNSLVELHTVIHNPQGCYLNDLYYVE